MKKVSVYQENFTKGEIDPRLHASPSLSAYREGLEEAVNVWVTATGAVAKRYGIETLHTFPTDSDEWETKLIPFRNASGTDYLCAARAGEFLLFNLKEGASPTAIPCEVLTAQTLPFLNFAAYGDSLIFVENGLPPQQLKWTGGDNFSVETIAFSNIPTFEFSPNNSQPTTTLTPSARAGYVTLTTGTDVFQPTDVGKYVEALPTGRVKIYKYNNARSAAGFVEEEFFDTTAVPAGNWTLERGWEPLWGDGAFPATCAFHEDRLVLANFPRARTTFAYSIAGAPFDFSTGDGSIAFGGARTLSRDQSDAIRHAYSANSLYFFCANAEYVIDQSATLELGLAPIRHDSSRGCLAEIKPLEGEDGGLYFFQPEGRGISEFRYYFDRASYEARNFASHFGHMLNLPRAASLWKGDEHLSINILFYVDCTGDLFAITLKLEEKICACCRLEREHFSFAKVCAAGEKLYVLQRDYGDPLRKIYSIGHFEFERSLSDGEGYTPYESKITLLPVAGETPFLTEGISTTTTIIYCIDAEQLAVNGKTVYAGAAKSGRFIHTFPSGFASGGKVTISDGSQTHDWTICGVGREALVGGPNG
ncbi:MAG: hypothetical protein LBP65_01895 [Puniceicoccales bacterium]|jgi:hypothetical protein|nr:hypothetical protein [Puniceicoccales bacterium]